MHNKQRGIAYKYKLLSYFMDNIPDVIYFKDTKGALVLVNQAHAKGLGMKPEDVAGKTDFDFFPKDKAKKMAKDDLRVINTGRPIIDKIERATRPDGVDNYVSTTKIAMRDQKGNIIGLAGITRDITRRMQFERLEKEKVKIEKKLEVLEAMNRVKSDFVSTVSHELRTPLAIIKQLVSLIFEETIGPINSKQKEVIKKVDNNIGRLKKLIEDLLDISRIERNKLELHYSLVNLNDLVKDSAEFYEKLAEEKGIKLKYSIPKTDINLFIDADRINQVISNLINNAIKFTEEGGRVSIEIKVLETKIRVEVIDTGIGIAKADLPQLFNKFVQTLNAGRPAKKGVGLGLSIVKELVERHGGEVWAESELGVGSKFYFTIPRFYRLDMLNENIKDKVDGILKDGIALQIINLIIINYEEFKKRIKIEPKRLFEDLKLIMAVTFEGISKDKPRDLPIILTDIKNGRAGIIFPILAPKNNARIVGVFKDKIKNYFMKHKVDSAFVNMRSRFNAKFSVKDIYVGLEMRRFERVFYKAKAKIFLPKNKTESVETIDISEGGICFMTGTILKTDSKVKVALEFNEAKGPVVHASARVAWIKKVELSSGESLNKYKVGVEFIGMDRKYRKIIARELKSQ